MNVREWSCCEIGRWCAHAIFLGAMCLCCATVPVRAGSLSSTQCSDTFLNNVHASNNNGGAPTFFTGESGENGIMRALIRCDLPAGIDARVQVAQVTLTLTTAGLGSTGTTPPTAAIESLRAVTEAWGEGDKAGLTTTTYTVGQPCTAGEATWNQRQCSIANWATAGGTVSGTLSASASSPASIGSSVTFTGVSCGIVDDVMNWIAAPSSNFGWRISSSTEGASAQAQRFNSSEASSGRPVLAVTYGCKAGFEDTGTGCTACTTAAKAACVTSQAGNACVDPGAPSSYSCTCGNPAYTGTGTQSCTDFNACVPNHCLDAGDTGALCTDHVAPATGYDCTCDAGFVFDGMTCSDRIFADDFEDIAP